MTDGRSIRGDPREGRLRISSSTEIRPPLIVGELTRPPALGRRYAISTTHHLATTVGERIFAKSGNAVDAGVAAGIALNVVEPHMCGFGGVAPIMIMTAAMSVPETIDGVGTWPAGITLADYVRWFGGDMPIGVERSVVPAAPDAWLTALARHGRLSLSDILEPVIELCMDGFAAHAQLVSMTRHFADRLRCWPTSMATFMPGGMPLSLGQQLRQPALGGLFEALVRHEHSALVNGADRGAAIMAARDAFYRGEIAERIVTFMNAEGWPLSAEDLAGYRVRIGSPASTDYRGFQVHACGPWSQGPMIPMMLNILEGFDLRAMGEGSAAFFHHYAEAVKLAAADREAFFGDPEFSDVPLSGLLDKRYAALRRAQIDAGQACSGRPQPGDPWPFEGRAGRPGHSPIPGSGVGEPDTSFVCAIDSEGNAFSATPSDHAFGAPVIDGLGIPLSARGGQFWLDEGHPDALAPGKRPRITPNPAILAKNGRPILAFGSPGEDTQTQAMVQFLCQYIDFGRPLQAAIEAPRVSSLSFPQSYHPHGCTLGGLIVEDSVSPAVRAQLAQLGHEVREQPRFTYGVGAVCAVELHAGLITGAADPRRDCVALAW